MDSSESELGILDLIQVFVETLDKCFENVCELDLIFHMDKVHYILNELVMGGMVLETNMTEILTRVEEQNKIEKEEVCNLLKMNSQLRCGTYAHKKNLDKSEKEIIWRVKIDLSKQFYN